MYSLNKKVYIEIKEGDILDLVPKYIFGNFEVVVSKAEKFEDFENEDTNHVGLGKHFFSASETDVFLFNKKSFQLNALRLSHSLIEKSPKNISLLDNVDTKKGCIELITKNKEDFKNIKPFKYRYYNAKENVLLGYGKKFLKSNAIHLKLEIAQDVFLLFNQNKKYCGWILKNPEKYIVQYYYYRKDDLDPHANFNHITSHPRLKEFYKKTYNFIEDDVLLDMSSEYIDPQWEILQKMHELYIEMNSLESPCIGIIALKDKLEDIAEYDYEKKFSKTFGEV